jgi:hypothetical protein
MLLLVVTALRPRSPVQILAVNWWRSDPGMLDL